MSPTAPRRARASHRHLALLALVAVLAPLACTLRPEPRRPRDVVVIVLDALRADALGCYGAERPTSPAIDAFAGAGRLAEHAFSAASYTLASMASVFTGHRPASHRVLGLESNVLPEDLPTLAEAFRAKGFRTAGFSSNPHITAEGGFARGFERFDYHPRDRFDVHRVPEALWQEALAWWRAQADAPRFLYVHVLPPHQPYDPPPPYASYFGADQGPRREGLTDTLTALQRSGAARRDPALARRLRDRYDANVAYADAWFGGFLAALDASGARESALVLLCSDHGEGFLEHGDLLHGANPFAEMTRVPLVVRAPDVEPGRVGGVASLADLAPSLCEWFDVPWSGAGRSFAAEIRAGRFDADREAVSRSMGARPVWALRRGTLTYASQPSGRFRALHDRADDPLELADLAARRPDEAQGLAARLEALLAADQRSAATRARPARHAGDRAALEALGYTGGDGLLREDGADDERIDDR